MKNDSYYLNAPKDLNTSNSFETCKATNCSKHSYTYPSHKSKKQEINNDLTVNYSSSCQFLYGLIIYRLSQLKHAQYLLQILFQTESLNKISGQNVHFVYSLMWE